VRKSILSIVACLSVAAVFTAPATAADCTNEAYWVGTAALLPEWRAYEMVSPPDKNGGNLGRILWVGVAPTGDAATFYSSAAFAGSPGSALSTGYIAHATLLPGRLRASTRRSATPATAC
jgi:hypothetical protein